MLGSGEGEGHYVFFLKVWHKWQSVSAEGAVCRDGRPIAFLFTCPFYGPDAPMPNGLNVRFTFSDSENKQHGAPQAPTEVHPAALPRPETMRLRWQLIPAMALSPWPPYLITSFLAEPVHFFSE